MKKIAVLTGGGDAPGMNAAVRSVVLKANDYQMDVVGIKYGFRGLIEKYFTLLDPYKMSDFVHTGGTRLFTSRYPEFKESNIQAQAIKHLVAEGIEGLVVFGGDGSSRGALALSKCGFPTISLPATIDNDMGGTDFSIGFDTALTTAVEAVDKIRDTATSHDRIFIVEVMGRGAGDIAYWTAISTDADRAVIPEEDFDMADVVEDIQACRFAGQKRYMIILAEGVMKAHDFVQNMLEIENFNVRVSQLGHIQRGGKPTPKDRVLASRLGAEAVDRLLSGHSGCSVGIRGSMVQTLAIEEALAEERTFLKILRQHSFDYLF